MSMEGLMRAFPREALRFLTRACLWSMFLGTINSSMLLKILTQHSSGSTTSASVKSVFTHVSTKYVFDDQSLTSHVYLFMHALIVLRLFLCFGQMCFRIVLYFKLSHVHKLFELERKAHDRVYENAAQREQEIDRLRHEAVHALVLIPQSIWWRINHTSGMISLLWLALGLAMVFAFDSLVKADMLRINLWFNVIVIFVNVLRTSSWLMRLGHDNVGGSVGGATNLEILTRTTLFKFGESSSLLSGEENSCCAICQDDFELQENVRRLSCGHTYHDQCIKNWLVRRRTCPYCQRTI
eukprot:TRINITY_DN13342_c0_g2_i1.p1 TRINITY_DN13342_c0_g2~~TRINITY_DN13342_c0_g2_i1.p1  ORF type:complete len:296 (-),score=49.14 TRINITY_DN13342_c0_g2_i1:158-1045(-)